MRNLQEAQSFLFVPGHRPDRFAKARDSGADQIIIDLEDAVGPDNKGAARTATRGWLAAGHTAIVRINTPGSLWYRQDVDQLGPLAPVVLLPKATAETVALAQADLPASCLIVALIETARGVLESATIARTGVTRLAFGNVDLGADVGVDPDDRQALLAARSTLVLASTAAGIAPPIDGVTASIDDNKALLEDTAHARSLGFTAKMCIHPRQITGVHEGFVPTASELIWASRVVEAAGAGDVVLIDGKMLDKPVVDRARTLIARQRQ